MDFRSRDFLVLVKVMRGAPCITALILLKGFKVRFRMIRLLVLAGFTPPKYLHTTLFIHNPSFRHNKLWWLGLVARATTGARGAGEKAGIMTSLGNSISGYELLTSDLQASSAIPASQFITTD